MSGPSVAELQQAALVSMLGQVRQANGYNTDAGARVHAELMDFTDSDESAFPLFNVQMRGELPSGQSAGIGSERVVMAREFRVEAWTGTDETGAASPSLLSLLADVKRAVLGQAALGVLSDPSTRKRFGALAYSGTETITAPQDGVSLGGISIIFTITAPENWGDPSSI